MSGHQTHQSDTSAAYIGLLGGSLLIGVILYVIVLFTNHKFAGEKAEGGEKKAAVMGVLPSVVA